jgi:L-threonylcarbamoyladenylate synthase
VSPWRLRQIAFEVKSGAVIAYPTDTIWGFGCHPLNDLAVTRIQQLKKRSRQKGLILLSSSLELCRPFLDPTVYSNHYNQLSTIQARPTTWIVKAHRNCPAWLTGNSEFIAFRITHRPHINTLCQSLQAPLVSTSANISGRKTARNGWLVHKLFQSLVDYIIEGHELKSAQASRIIELESGKILRA